MHWANIDDSGWVWAPVLKLSLPDTDPDRRKSAITSQQLSYENTTTTTSITSVLLHPLPIHSITIGNGDGPRPYSMTVQAKYTPREELSP